ncbi:hypothetical protein GCK32_014046 [Trichostrongylus colubriformis]|uniref:DUF7774 domain-containing protein n=1 Tax=Trichostrongylus colubriformis TaxID=6319 RepID=A0AAN8J326_TRICO
MNFGGVAYTERSADSLTYLSLYRKCVFVVSKQSKRPRKASQRQRPREEVSKSNHNDIVNAETGSIREAQEDFNVGEIISHRDFPLALRVMVEIKKHRMLENSLSPGDTEEVRHFFESEMSCPSYRVMRLIHEALNKCWDQLMDKYGEFQFSNEILILLCEREKLKLRLFDVMMAYPDFIPVSWGGRHIVEISEPMLLPVQSLMGALSSNGVASTANTPVPRSQSTILSDKNRLEEHRRKEPAVRRRSKRDRIHREEAAVESPNHLKKSPSPSPKQRSPVRSRTRRKRAPSSRDRLAKEKSASIHKPEAAIPSPRASPKIDGEQKPVVVPKETKQVASPQPSPQQVVVVVSQTKGKEKADVIATEKAEVKFLKVEAVKKQDVTPTPVPKRKIMKTAEDPIRTLEESSKYDKTIPETLLKKVQLLREHQEKTKTEEAKTVEDKFSDLVAPTQEFELAPSQPPKHLRYKKSYEIIPSTPDHHERYKLSDLIDRATQDDSEVAPESGRNLSEKGIEKVKENAPKKGAEKEAKAQDLIDRATQDDSEVVPESGRKVYERDTEKEKKKVPKKDAATEAKTQESRREDEPVKIVKENVNFGERITKEQLQEPKEEKADDSDTKGEEKKDDEDDDDDEQE